MAYKYLYRLLFISLAGLAANIPVNGTGPPERMADFFGVNTVVSDEPGDVAAYAGWVRDYTAWEWFEPGNNAYEYRNVMGKFDFDRTYQIYRNTGVKVLMCIQQSPRWISANPEHEKYMGFAPSGKAAGNTPEDYREAAEFFFQTTARYGRTIHDPKDLLTADQRSGLGLIAAVEVLNEADGDESWGNHVTIEQYAALLNAVYDGDRGRLGRGCGVKAADPGMPVSITGAAYGLKTIKAITAAAGRAPYDIINLHYYCFTMDPRKYVRVATPPEWSDFAKEISDTVVWRDANAPGKPIWLTEIGWDSNPEACTEGVPETKAADYLIRSMIIAKGAGADKCFWFFNMDTDHVAHGIFSTCGLFRNSTVLNPEPPPRYTPKLTYWYYCTLKSLIGPTRFLDKVRTDDPTVYHYRFRNEVTRETISVLWYCPVYNPRKRQPDPETVVYAFSPPAHETVRRIIRPKGGSRDGEALPFNPTEAKAIGLELSSTPLFVITEE